MPKKKQSEFSPEYVERYLELLGQVQSDLKALIYQIESETSNKLSDRLPTEMEFDAIPILRKLREAERLAGDSVFHYQPVLRRLSR